jgi:CPA1 family monovalent cation:H+ antiporter
MIDVLEGESLINDASGLLALEFTVALVVTGQTPDVLEGGGRLLFLVVGGVAVGLILGKLVDWVERRIDDAPIEITISLVTPYVAYLGAESIHSSGVLAAVACGLYLGRRSATYFSSTVRIEAWAFWNTLTFVLNGIVFILIGLQLPYILGRIQHLSLGELLLRGALFSAVVILLRMIWMYPGAYFSYLIRRRLLGQPEPTPPARAVFIAGWAGMRGVVALAAAISLPATFPQRDVILFLTFCVIFVTLVLQGLTLPALIRRLGVMAQPLAPCEELEARQIMIEAALSKLDQSPDRQDPEMKEIYDDVAGHYRQRLPEFGPRERHSDGHHRFEQISRRLRDEERAAAVLLRDQDRISDEVLRGLLRELDLLDARESGR